MEIKTAFSSQFNHDAAIKGLWSTRNGSFFFAPGASLQNQEKDRKDILRLCFFTLLILQEQIITLLVNSKFKSHNNNNKYLWSWYLQSLL